jgi:putative endonuclease
VVRDSTRRVGINAEQLAFRYLRHNGLKPVRRNFRSRRGEIDLIMLDAECLVFVEVRYRNEASFVRAALTVDSRKQRKLTQTASMFLSMNKTFGNKVCRFDVVGVDRDCEGEITIDWMRDAFRPGM